MAKAATFFVLLAVVFTAVNAQALSRACQIVENYGYPCEDHLAPTTDGWLLSVQRIPAGISGINGTRGVILFQHGLTDSSAGALLNGPAESFPFIFADAGYDVWLGNNRGNGVSMTNKNFNPDQAGFWAFSYDEMAMYDLPAEINYILAQTGKAQLTYIGHSEGTTQAFAGFVTDVDLASKVNLFVALAPVATTGHVTSLILQAMAKLDADEIMELLGAHEFYLPGAVSSILPGFCEFEPNLCKFVLTLLTGPFPSMNTTRSPYYLQYEPNPTSVQNMAHWAQSVRTGKFQMFDFGAKQNIVHYGTPYPPQYDLSKWPASLPVALFAGSLDALGDPADTQILLQMLPISAQEIVHYETSYGHLDPLLGVDARIRIYPLMLQLIDKANGHSK